jgi:hypothetical protein
LAPADTGDGLNHRLQVEIDPSSEAPSLSWWGTAGETYFIQVATDLGFGWQYIDAIFQGADAPLSYEFSEMGNASFFRLRSTDQPTGDPWTDNFDGDYLSNADELSLFGTDPLRYDSNGDGLGDGYTMPGYVRVEVWDDVDTRFVSALTSEPNFPHFPDASYWLQQLESPRNVNDYYGQRVRGFIIPDETRDYVFYLTADDQAEFWLSTDDHTFNKTLLLGPISAGWDRWDQHPEQSSGPVALQAGLRYYFDILHKERKGNDHFQVGWSQPGGAVSIIPQANLQSWQPDPEDQDDDGLQDSWELAHGLDPTDNGSANLAEGSDGDFDFDGLSNLEESRIGTDVTLRDTDGDGNIDWVEQVYFGTSATDASDLPASTISQDWETRNIGTPITSIAYRDSAVDSKRHLLAAGRGIVHDTFDSMGYFYRTVTGDFSVTMSYDKAAQSAIQTGQIALMARESLSADSRYVAALNKRALSVFNLVSRLETGGEVQGSGYLGSPASYTNAWVRLERQGNRFIAYASSDNAIWTLIGEQSLDLPLSLHLGFSLHSESLLEYTSAVIEVPEWNTDFDQDGIWDADEATYGTSPTSADFDGDGYSDYDEINEFYSDPLVADLSPAQVVAQEEGSAAVATLGDWIEDGSVLYVAGGRGAVEYDLDVPEDAIYRLGVTAQNRSNQTRLEHYEIKVAVDGVFIGRLGLDDIEDAPGSDGILTPWLTAGTHRVRFFVENTYTHRVLQINSVEMQLIGGPDVDHNGSPDWMDQRLLANNSVLNLAIDGSITESAVSPFCLEGRSRYLDFSQSTDPGLELQGLPDYGFYTDVPLDATSDTATGLIFENGGHSASGTLRWTATDVLTADSLTLRKGDSLRLTAIDADDPADQPISISIDGGPATSASESAPIQQRFDTAGAYTVSASVGSLSGTLQVTVLEAELGAPVDVFRNVFKDWQPDLLSALAVMESDSRLVLNEIAASDPRTFSLTSHDSNPRYLAARTHQGGAVLDSLAVTGFRLASNNQARVEVVETYDDGAVLVEVDVVLDYVPDDLVIEARIFVAGVTFADGSLVQTLTAAEFGELGRATLQFIMPFEASASICHRLHMYIGDQYIGQF